MTESHPITPPPELVQQWAQMTAKNDIVLGNWVYIATQAARWGADTELDACCEWFVRDWTDIETADKLRAARRPKPLSLKEQALDAWIRLRNEASCKELDGDLDCLLRALESLPS
jgi:hypothetical protein